MSTPPDVIALEFDLSTAKALIPLADARRFHDEEPHRAGAWVTRALIRLPDGRETMVFAKSWKSPDGKLARVGLGAYGDTLVALPPPQHFLLVNHATRTTGTMPGHNRA